MAQLDADEDFDYNVVEALRLRGHDVLTVQEAGQGNKKIGDAAVLAFEVTRGRAVITFNRRHFKRCHRHNSPHCGIIVCTRDQDAEALADRIHQEVSTAGDLSNRLLSVVRGC